MYKIILIVKKNLILNEIHYLKSIQEQIKDEFILFRIPQKNINVKISFF